MVSMKCNSGWGTLNLETSRTCLPRIFYFVFLGKGKGASVHPQDSLTMVDWFLNDSP